MTQENIIQRVTVYIRLPILNINTMALDKESVKVHTLNDLLYEAVNIGYLRKSEEKKYRQLAERSEQECFEELMEVFINNDELLMKSELIL